MDLLSSSESSDTPRICLTVLFEAPFWIGLYERTDRSLYEVCKITFGPEPKDYEVYDFLLKNGRSLHFSPPVLAEKSVTKPVGHKRMQRQIKRSLQNTGIGTKAQQALQLQREQSKTERKTRSREQKEAEKQRQFALRQEKRKEKHRGR